jgi:peroxiredoxin Q/BCP
MKQAPEFCLPNQDGAEISLRDLSGKWVVLYFYPKDDTSGCTTEACDFTNSLGDFENLDAIVIGISPDSVAKHKKFVDKYNLKITLLADEEKTALSAYGVWQEKSMYGKKYMGVVRTTLIINPDGNIVKQFDKVKVKEHVDAVAVELKALQAI